ncbi:hypothetical protein [Streptomyces sp. NPDC096193]|uniref:hypothetical protein n=1 Tax=Streptomyces sp. NPDC096193 TaxID=3155821 RepID=UPI003327E2A0
MTKEQEPSGSDAEVVEQHNHGSGAFVGRDNNGVIRIEALDAKTKAYLGHISKDAPALGALLRKSLREGTISPDTASQLMMAARSINEDVARSLWEASRHINEDVAHSLWEASRRINEDVAGQISRAADNLAKVSDHLQPDDFSKVVTRFEAGLVNLERLTKSVDELRALTGEIERLQGSDRPFGRIEHIGVALSGAAERIEATVTPPRPRLIVDKGAQAKAFFWGLGIGMAFIFYLWQR